MRKLDYTFDISGADTHKLATLYAAPDFVKEASSDDLSGLHASAFAGPDRSFPVHSPKAIWLSAAFWTQNYKELPKAAAEKVASEILVAARLHNVLPEVQAVFEKAAQIEDLWQQDDGLYGLEFTQDGQVIKSFPINNTEEIKIAADQFEAKRNQLSPEMRKKLASAITSQAVLLDVAADLPESVLKTAGCGYATPALIAEAWWSRAAVMRERQNSPAAEEAVKTAKAYTSVTDPVADAEVLEKVASHIQDFDATHKLTHLYGTTLNYPEEAIYIASFQQLHKMASQTVKLTTGSVYELADLASLPLEKMSELLGSDIVKELRCPLSGDLDMEKVATILPSLPRPDAVMLEQLFEGTQIVPVLSSKRAFSVLS